MDINLNRFVNSSTFHAEIILVVALACGSRLAWESRAVYFLLLCKCCATKKIKKRNMLICYAFTFYFVIRKGFKNIFHILSKNFYNILQIYCKTGCISCLSGNK